MRALSHTHTHKNTRARRRACVTLSFEYTPPCGSHPGTHPRTVTKTHTPAGEDARATRTHALPDSHTYTDLSLRLRPRKCQHAGHIYAHLDTQGQRKTKIIEVERSGKMGKRPIDTYPEYIHTPGAHSPTHTPHLGL